MSPFPHPQQLDRISQPPYQLVGPGQLAKGFCCQLTQSLLGEVRANFPSGFSHP